MKLSVLISTYNYNCSDLLHELKRQIDKHSLDAEVIVKDDASTNKPHSSATHKAADECGFAYISLTKNVGRAAIRNSLADDAKGDYLLFLDCDAMPATASFLHDYIKLMGKADVVCGTVAASSLPIEPHQMLRWVYDHTSAPRFTAANRRKHPYRSLTTFCFMIRADVFHAIRFDESFTGYGYEDTMFGAALEKRGASILHEDIIAEHRGLETNEAFLEKIKRSNETLLAHRSELQSHSTLLRCLSRIEAFHGVRLAAMLYRCLSNKLEHHLLHSAKPSYRLLQSFKLLQLAYLKEVG